MLFAEGVGELFRTLLNEIVRGPAKSHRFDDEEEDHQSSFSKSKREKGKRRKREKGKGPEEDDIFPPMEFANKIFSGAVL